MTPLSSVLRVAAVPRPDPTFHINLLRTGSRGVCRPSLAHARPLKRYHELQELGALPIAMKKRAQRRLYDTLCGSQGFHMLAPFFFGTETKPGTRVAPKWGPSNGPLVGDHLYQMTSKGPGSGPNSRAPLFPRMRFFLHRHTDLAKHAPTSALSAVCGSKLCAACAFCAVRIDVCVSARQVATIEVASSFPWEQSAPGLCK